MKCCPVPSTSLHHVTYSFTKFEVPTYNGLGGDTFTRNVTDGRTHGRTDGQTDGRRTDFDTKLIYPFSLKKKAGIIIIFQGSRGAPTFFSRGVQLLLWGGGVSGGPIAYSL